MSLPRTFSYSRSSLAFLAGTAVLLTVIICERIEGRVWWCACRKWFPVSLHINSMHNSQHLLDVYSFTHVLHGLIFFGLFWFLRNRVSFSWRLVAAMAIESAWEILENSSFIINRYRAGTASLGYSGDSIANSLGDIGSAIAGFYLARWLGLWRCITVFIVVELVLLLTIRDNLTLNVLMLLWPIDMIRKWQMHA